MNTNELTKIGFSKSFSCCGRFMDCNYGKGVCVYESIDPEVKDGCHLRSRMQQKIKTTKEDEFNLGKGGQLSFFD